MALMDTELVETVLESDDTGVYMYKGNILSAVPALDHLQSFPEEILPVRVLILLIHMRMETGEWSVMSNPQAFSPKTSGVYFVEHVFGAVANTLVHNGVTGLSRAELVRRSNQGRQQKPRVLDKITYAEIFDPMQPEVTNKVEFREKQPERRVFKIPGALFLKKHPAGDFYRLRGGTGEYIYHADQVWIAPKVNRPLVISRPVLASVKPTIVSEESDVSFDQ